LRGVVTGGGLPVLRDVERIARQRVTPQRVLLVNLEPQQFLEFDLRLLDLRLVRERAGDLGARFERALNGKSERHHQERGH